MDKEKIYNLVKDVTPAFFGLGFIQCKINDKQRIHFYHPSLVPTVNIEEEIHNHRYDFTSTILRGQINNKKYHFIESETATHYLQDESCNENVKVSNLEKKMGRIVLYEDKIISEGQSYFMDHNDFHTVKADICITMLERTPYKKQFAQVVRPIEGSVICPFSKKLTIDECWKVIEECLDENEN